jgi:hypothetical protein
MIAYRKVMERRTILTVLQIEVKGFLFIEDLDFDINVSNLNAELLDHVSYAESSAIIENAIVLSQGPGVVESNAQTLGGKIPLGPGFQDEPDPELLAANLEQV